MTIGLGRRHQRLEDRLAVQLGLRRRQAVDRLRLRDRLPCIALLRLPVAVGLVGDRPEGGQATVGNHLAADLARTLAAQQQTQRASRQGPATGALEQSSEISVALAAFAGTFATAEQATQSIPQTAGR
ncbi:hypothetical protein D3C84_794430 [compost metagenome]